MKTPGSYLRESREKKGVTYHQISADTNIATRYIIALEQDKFDDFPGGEAYFLGFLRTYADYLGIVDNEILRIYRNYKLAEEPTPMKELMNVSASKNKPFIIGIITGLLFGSGFMVLGIFTVKHLSRKYYQKKNDVSQQKESVTESKTHLVSEDQGYKGKLYLGDYIKVVISGIDYFLMFTDMRGAEVDFVWKTANELDNTGKFSTKLGEEIICPFGNSDSETVILRIIDIGLLEDSVVNVEVEKIVNFNREIKKEGQAAAIFLVEQEEVPKDFLRKNYGVDDLKQRRVIMSMKSPIRIDVSVLFTGNTNFRYLLDSRESHERYYQEGEKLQRSMTSNFKLWTSNAGKTRLKIRIHEVPLGKDGEIVVKKLHWVYNKNHGSYDLVLDEQN